MAVQKGKKFSDAVKAVKNLPACPVPKGRKGHNPNQVQALKQFQGRLQTHLSQLYKKFGRAHKAEANHYLKHSVANLKKSLT